MCILMYYGPNAMPIEDHLRYGCENNPDGFGWAVVVYAEDRIIMGHSMDEEKAMADFIAARTEYPQDCALFHARIATAGSVNTDNCHPFKVNGRPNMVLGHNGVLPMACQPAKGDLRSDTRILADGMFMSRWGSFDDAVCGDKTTKNFEAWLGTGSKVVILTTDRRYSHQSYIFNEHLGFWLDEKDGHDPLSGDIWYSNTSHCKRTRYTGTGWSWASARDYESASYKRWWEDAEESTDIGYKSFPKQEMGCRNCGFIASVCPCAYSDKILVWSNSRDLMRELNDPTNPLSWVCVNEDCELVGYVDEETKVCVNCHTCHTCGTANETSDGCVKCDAPEATLASLGLIRRAVAAITSGREAL